MTRRHPSLPPAASLPWLAVALAVWVGMALTWTDHIPDPISPGRTQGHARLITDVVEGRFGPWVLVESEDGVLLLDLKPASGLTLGDRVVFEGVANGRAGTVRGRHHRSRVEVTSLDHQSGATPPPLVLGNAVREHVMRRLHPFNEGRALLAGFLIGDTSELDRSDVEAMRLSGLSHFVAVSGSNVALFLVLLALAAGPLALGPKRRAVIGLLGLPVYVAATRFEPSVLRASVMAGLALGGRLVGIVLEAWQLLALAVVILVIADPSITWNVGFQLSVVATAGVLVGARWPLSGGKAQRALAVTCGAQVAVTPILLIHFGSIPLFSPLANLVAAPLVTVSTLLGAIGVVSSGLLIDLASWLASLVLHISRTASGLPQLPPVIAAWVGVILICWWRWPVLRTWIAVGGAAAVIWVVIGFGPGIPDPGAVVLDVGQGDSILLHGGPGRFALVDGGPDPSILIAKLRSYGVKSLDLVVITHVHADHVAGLTGLLGRIPIGEVWMAFDPHETPSSRAFVGEVERWVSVVRTPTVGELRTLGSLLIRVDGPLRRYASPNDQSIVLTAEGPNRSILLSGDIEIVAQRELTHLRADVLKVPHQGAATSDPDWLAGVGSSEALISVGPNAFGHPAEWVIELLVASGAHVRRTDLEGDLAVGL